jgi:hypothetical protein
MSGDFLRTDLDQQAAPTGASTPAEASTVHLTRQENDRGRQPIHLSRRADHSSRSRRTRLAVVDDASVSRARVATVRQLPTRTRNLGLGAAPAWLRSPVAVAARRVRVRLQCRADHKRGAHPTMTTPVTIDYEPDQEHGWALDIRPGGDRFVIGPDINRHLPCSPSGVVPTRVDRRHRFG